MREGIGFTDAGNLSAYILTKLISITDGQIVLDAKLFHVGQKPAVDVGTSVSRVGGKTQAPVLREAAQTLRLDYAQFLELEMFTRFGGMPDTRVRDQLTRGARIRAIFDQVQRAPMRLADEIVRATDEGRAITPAAEWLIDNYHLVEKQIREIRTRSPGAMLTVASSIMMCPSGSRIRTLESEMAVRAVRV